MILVTGATGHVGREVIARLVALRQGGIRAVTRRPDAVHFPPEVQVVAADAGDPGSLGAAFAGVDAAFLMSAQPVGSAAHPTHDIALATAARRAGVRHVVKLSVFDGGGPDDALGAWHREAEAAITEAGFDWTLLRPGRFASNAGQWAPMIARGDAVTIPFAGSPAAPIDPADIAAVAVAAFFSDRHHGMSYQLSGPETLTPADELRILGRVLGRSLRVVEPSIDATREQLIRYGMPAPVVEAILSRVRSGDGSGARVLPTVADILGRPPATFAHWAEAHRDLFGGIAPGQSDK
jgi:uncharacterized protein YbjT (DUF2867 family)